MAISDGYTVRLIDNTSDFERAEAEWKRLEQEAGHSNITASYDWLRTWWSVFASRNDAQFGRRKQLRILLLYQGPELVAIAPLVRLERRALLRSIVYIEFLAQQWGATMLDLISRDPSPAITHAVMDWLQTNERYDVLHLSYIPEHTKHFCVSDESATVLSACPLVHRKDYADYDEYCRMVQSKNLRRMVRKSFRRMKEKQWSYEFVTGPADAAALAEMRRLSLCKLGDRKGSPFTDRDKARFLAAIYTALPSDVRFLRINGRAAAYTSLLSFGDGVFAYDTSYDRELRDVAPGQVLRTENIRLFFAEGRHAFLCGGTGLGFHKRRHYPRVVKIYSLTRPGNTRRAPAYAARLLERNREVARRFEQELTAWLETE